jgi:GH25 family lysozyme M1 (1,4-beta-N-acetylmuramidase)
MATNFKSFPVRLFDISHHQDNADTSFKPVFEKMAAAGFLGVIVRVGYGRMIDRMFQYFWAQAKGKLERMPYWYLDYYSHKGKMGARDWGREQANQCHAALKRDFGEMPLALDCEEFSGAWRINLLNRADYREVMKGFLDEWKLLAGSYPVIYSAPGFYWVFEDWVKGLDLWMAWYNRSITTERAIEYAREKGWKGKIILWQYTSDGDVNDDGIPDGKRMGFETDALDLNVWLGSTEGYSIYCGKHVIAPPPPPQNGDEEPVATVETLMVIAGSGLNIRDVPIGQAGSQVIGWLPKGTQVKPLEILQEGNDIWARIGKWKCAAVKFNGVEMMK